MELKPVSAALFGQTAKRREDLRLVTGAGAFTADRRDAGAAFAVFVRSPHAHAEIRGIDANEARRSPGVLGVFTSADLAADNIGPISTGISHSRPDGKPSPKTPRHALARGRTRFVGEPVALVVAETQLAALEAAERVNVDYADLPSVTTIEGVLASGAPALWDEAPDNAAFVWRGGNAESTAAALARASHVTRAEFSVSRVTAAPIEPRVCFASPKENGRLELQISHQSPFGLRGRLANEIFHVEPASLRILVKDVGGSFGMKSGVYPEDAAILWAARRLNRPVTWTSTRVEAMQADEHAREMKITTELGFEGSKISAFRVRVDHMTGAYLSERSLYPLNNIGGIAGVYRIPNIACEIYGYVTNTVPTGPYRGAGRPEATFMIERTLDIAARELGLDPFKVRYRNLIPAKAMPFKTAFVFTYDVGEFAGNMDEAAKLADLENFPARRREAKKRGKLRGIGICNPIEVAAGPFLKPGRDAATVTIRPDGTILLVAGVLSTGQGLETAFSQLVADTFGVPIEKVEYRQGDTDLAPYGRGSGGSAATSVGGTAVSIAVNAAVERAAEIAADTLEVGRADLELRGGRFVIAGTDRAVSLGDVARKAEEAGQPLRESGEFQPEKVNFPNGCHICEVEVDPETGRVAVISYCAVEDVGRVLNAALLQGQIHGGVAQGIGQALGEKVVYDPDTGQLLTASFMDYAMPRASLMPQMKLVSREIPTKTNALGVKGVGEAGAVGALAATINAVCDALSPLGVRHVEMPATPARVWAAIQAAKGNAGTV